MDATAQDLIARLRRNPQDSEAFAALRAHYQRVGDYASLANLLEGWAGQARDAVAGAHALHEAGELVLGALADRERAIKKKVGDMRFRPRLINGMAVDLKGFVYRVTVAETEG